MAQAIVCGKGEAQRPSSAAGEAGRLRRRVRTSLNFLIAVHAAHAVRLA